MSHDGFHEKIESLLFSRRIKRVKSSPGELSGSSKQFRLSGIGGRRAQGSLDNTILIDNGFPPSGTAPLARLAARTQSGFHNRRYPIFFVRQSRLMRLKKGAAAKH